jgi:hypothetical protein
VQRRSGKLEVNAFNDLIGAGDQLPGARLDHGGIVTNANFDLR